MKIYTGWNKIGERGAATIADGLAILKSLQISKPVL
jgi:hypothetical protein